MKVAPHRDEIIVEWIDSETVLQKARAAMRKSGVQDIDSEMANGVTDWVELECCMSSRKFPSIPMAKCWAKKNHDRDWFGQPRIYLTRTVPRHHWPLEDVETIEEWHFDGVDDFDKVMPLPEVSE